MSKENNTAFHLWHCWMNNLNENKAGGDTFDHSVYEFKNMLQFLEYGHKSIQEAFEGRLPMVHQQCSHSTPVKLESNTLRCACEGIDVTQCPMLLGIKKEFDEYREKVPDEQLYRVMANTCAWHSYKVCCGINGKRSYQCGLSEGYLLDGSDRMFWRNVYDSLA